MPLAGAPDTLAGGAGLKGALYTGRGPVWGTIILGGGACGGAGATGATGRATIVGVAGWSTEGRGGVAAGAAEVAVGAAGATTTGRGATGADEAAGDTEAAGGGGAGGAGTEKVGLGVEVGTTNFGGAAGGVLGAFGSGALTLGGAGVKAGLVSTGAGAVGDGAAAAAGVCCLLMMAFSASPGLEIWERSILVLISSASGRPSREERLELCAWLAARNCARTFSASWSSRELEWLFFSVTPISGSTSRIDLLLTSSSLARSLIRILLIRPFRPTDCPR